MMMNDVMNSTSVQKLKSILHNRYGKNLSISTMNEVSEAGDESQSFQIMGNDLRIPICVNNRFFATASINEASHLSSDEQLAISYLVRMILEPTFYNMYLARISENATSMSQMDNESMEGNVVSLFNNIMSETELDIDDGFEAMSIVSSIVCVQSHNPYMIQKTASEIHDISKRWAFLKYADIQNNITCAQDLKDMGAVTLLIEDVLTLNPEMQASLAQILKSTSQTQDPLFVIGITGSLKELQDQGMINEDLARLLGGHLLDVDRVPTERKLFKQTLELFMEQDQQS